MELLVVVTIIVILIALLTPALDKAVESGERAVCASRLHQWGMAQSSYWLDNGRRLMGVVKFYDTTPYPNVVWAGSVNKGGQFAVDPIRDYIQGLAEVRAEGGIPVYRMGGAWYCPATVLTPEKDAYNTKRREKTQADATNAVDTAAVAAQDAQFDNDRAVPPFYVPDYAYFARVSEIPSNLVTHPRHLTDRSPEPGRILMMDTLYRWNSGGRWSFNHSEVGPSIFSPNVGGPNHTGEPPIHGVNQLFGDGSVAWKPGAAFDTVAMEAGTSYAPHVGNADRNFY